MAHIRSILPQRGGVSPVDNNTVALFHYDEHVKDNLRGLSPIGNQTSLGFNGTSSHITFNNDPVFNTSSMTISARIFLSTYSTDTNTGSVIASNYGNPSGFIFYISNTGKLAFRPHGGTGTADLKSTETISLNKWYHVAATYDGSTMRLYIDGVAKETAAYANALGRSGLTIGKAAWTNGSYFNGRLEDIYFSGVVASASEIVDIYMSNFDNSNAIGYWKLNEGGGNIAYDYSKNGNDAVINNGIWLEGFSVYSLVSGGYPGGTGRGVLLEEGTTNILSSSNILSTGGAGANPAGTVITSDTSEKWNEYNSFKVVPLSTSANAGIFYSRVSGISSSSKYTFSVYLKGEGTHKISAEQYDSSGVRVSTPTLSGITLTSDWQRYVFTFDTATTTTGITMCIYTTSAQAVTYWASAPQLEKKSFATSFTKESRGEGVLVYPDNIINIEESTVSFWYKPTHNPDVAYGSQEKTAKMFQIGRYYNNGSITIWNLGNNLNIHLKGQTASGWTGVINAGNVFTQDEWTMITLTWTGGTQFKLYVNGVLKGSATSSTSIGPFSNGLFYVGGEGLVNWYGGISCNGIIDEVRIDKVARTSTEVAAWYYQGRNGW